MDKKIIAILRIYFGLIWPYVLGMNNMGKTASYFDQEVPQPHTADQLTAPRDRATEV